MNRGRSHQTIFHDDTDRQFFVGLLLEVSERFNVQTHAYCLMSNHYHLLMHTESALLGRAMRHLNGVFTQFSNRRYGRDGTLFRGRYASRLICDDAYLLWVSRYIHRNPVEAGLCAHATSWRWSSMRAYLGRAATPAWLDPQVVLGHFDNRPEKYEAFVEDLSLRDDMCGDLDKAVIGEPPRVVQQLTKVRPDKETDPARNRTMPRPSLEQIDLAVSEAFGVPSTELHINQRGRSCLPRHLAVRLGQRLGQFTQSELAIHYGYHSYSGIASALQRLDSKLKKDSGAAALLVTIAAHLSATDAADKCSQAKPASARNQPSSHTQ
ncbi:MAG: transposase [Acidimicrobiales bacterium]